MSFRLLKWPLLVAVLIQAVPYGHSHENPPVVAEPMWNSPATRALFQRACFDCHSNETVWPWYSHIAPLSWMVQNDVDGGREHLNFSEWNREQPHAKDVAEEVSHGDMPPGVYLPFHPAAKLTETELKTLIDGADKTLGPQSVGEKKGNIFQ
jgi:mono/diheme cytochrome c family protein